MCLKKVEGRTCLGLDSYVSEEVEDGALKLFFPFIHFTISRCRRTSSRHSTDKY